MKKQWGLMAAALIMMVGAGLYVLVGASTNAEEMDTVSSTDKLLGAVIEPARAIDDFSLPSTTGADFTLSEHRGEVVLLYFGYMTCPDVCPTTLADLQRAYRALGTDAEQVTVVFITVDPERDTLERMAAYTGAFHADFIGVRGNTDALPSLLEQFGVNVTRREVDSALGYLVDHTASVFLIGPDGQLHEQFLYGTPYEDIVHDVQLFAVAARVSIHDPT